MVDALGDGDWAVVTVPHGIDGRDIVERHRGRSVSGEGKETCLVSLVGKRDNGLLGLPGYTAIT